MSFKMETPSANESLSSLLRVGLILEVQVARAIFLAHRKWAVEKGAHLAVMVEQSVADR